MFKYYLAVYSGMLLTAVSQLLFKLGANRTRRRSAIFVFANPLNLAACTLLLGVTLLNTYAYKYLPLKLVVVVLPFTYVLVGLFSYTFLRERLNRKQWLGTIIILLGVIVYNL